MMLEIVWRQDAVCGDGVCSSPEETPGVGRFGWYKYNGVKCNII